MFTHGHLYCIVALPYKQAHMFIWKPRELKDFDSMGCLMLAEEVGAGVSSLALFYDHERHHHISFASCKFYLRLCLSKNPARLLPLFERMVWLVMPSTISANQLKNETFFAGLLFDHADMLHFYLFVTMLQCIF